MPVHPEDLKPLPGGDFRIERAYLADHVFLNVPGGGEPPNDPIAEESWDGIMSLPTDVLLRTTDYQSSMLEDCHDQWAAWIETTPMEPAQSAYMFEPALDAADEIHAAPFIAGHGWYRQATAGLRNALEAMSHAAAFAVRNDLQHYTEWRVGALEPKFGNAADLLAADANLANHEQQLRGGGPLWPQPRWSRPRDIRPPLPLRAQPSRTR